MRTWSIVAASALAAAVTASTRAALPVVYTNLSNLQPGTAGQVVLVYVAGTDSIQGENLNFQINNGGYGPTITGVDIIAGTIFAPSNTGQTHIPDPASTSFNSQGICIAGTFSGHWAYVQTTIGDLSVVATDNGLLATLTLSTVGATGNAFTLNMVNAVTGTSTFDEPGPTQFSISYPHNQISIGSSAARDWKINGTGSSWDSDANWTPFAPYAAGDIANFTTGSGTAIITLDGKRTVGTLNFNDAVGSYDLQAGTGGALLLDNGSQAALIACLAGNHTVSVPTTLSASTTVSVASASTLTLAGGLSGGSAALSLVGPGKLVLTGSANSYGTTNIASGSTLQVGNGTASGSLGTGAISNGGVLVLGAMATPLAGPLTGTGTFTVTGASTITNIDSEALTNITSTGYLQVGNGGTAGALMGGSVVNNGILAFDRSDAFTHTSTISGSGTLTQIGTGTTTLAGAANYSGPTVIAAGQLAFGGGATHSIAGVSGTGSLAVAFGTTLTSDGVNMPAGSLIVAGTQTIRSSGTTGAYYNFATGQSATTLTGTSKIAGAGLNITGTLDIKNNALIVEAADSTSKATLLATLAGELGTTITSSTATTNSHYTLDVIDNGQLGASFFGGLPVDPNSIIVTEALKGDANMDGNVTLADLTIWKANFGKANVYAANIGDYNHDGNVTLADLTIWKSNFGAGIGTYPAPSDASTGGLTTLPTATYGGGISAVPEPASLSALGIGALLLLRRRPGARSLKRQTPVR